MKKPASIRQLALDCLLQLEDDEVSISAILDNKIEAAKLHPSDRSLLNTLVYGVTRWRKRLDWVLDSFMPSHFRLDASTRNLLRIGAYQLLFLDRIPSYAAINETVALARGVKTTRFVNAVLRAVQRDADTLTYPTLESQPAQHISITQSFPLWLVERWLKRHGRRWTLAFCRACNEVAPLSLRVNTLKTSRETFAASLKSAGFAPELSPSAPDGLRVPETSSPQLLPGYPDGWFYVQDESAMLVSHLLGPLPGERIIDLCAAPGGKTTHIAQQMQNRGEIFAVDASQQKLRRIRHNCHRLGITNVRFIDGDATGPIGALPDKADRVLLDAPCSGLGTLRRHPDVRWKKSESQIEELTTVQLALLRQAAKKVKPGGVLVYSTCSTEPEENSEIVSRFLKEHAGFVTENVGQFLSSIPVSAVTPEGFLQTFPHEHGVDGAFAARLRARD